MARPAKRKSELIEQGTFRKDRHADRIELSVLKQIPPPPSDFDAEHSKEWERVCRLLIFNAEIMTQVDVESVRAYCELSVMCRKLWRNILEKGNTFQVKDGPIKANPAVEQYTKIYGLLFRMYERFAFDPRSRQALKVESGKSKEADDPLLTLNDN